MKCSFCDDIVFQIIGYQLFKLQKKAFRKLKGFFKLYYKENYLGNSPLSFKESNIKGVATNIDE